MFWDVLRKVIQSNAIFGPTDCLEVHLDHVRMPAGSVRERTKGRSLGVLRDKKEYSGSQGSLLVFGSRSNN